MKLSIGALMSVVLIYSLSSLLEAQTTGTFSDDPVIAAQEAQQQAQFAYENQLTELNNSANQAKEGLLSRRNTLNRELQNCFIQKNEAEIQAQQQADQANQQATNQLIQGAQQGLTPLLQNFDSANKLGKEEAKSQKEAAVTDQNNAVTRLQAACKTIVPDAEQLKFTGVVSTDRLKQSNVQRRTNEIMLNTEPTVDQNCKSAAQSLQIVSSQAKREIDVAAQAEKAAGGNGLNMALAAAALGVNYYGYSQGKKAAEAGLEDANRLNKMSYDACQQGVQDEAAEIDRQLANIDKQLASDRDRLAKQFAQFKVNIPNSVQSKSLLNVDEGNELPTLGGVGSAVAATQFTSPENPFNNLNQGAGGDSAGNAGGAAPSGSGAGAGGGDGKAGWGFRDPYETNNPGLAYTLPLQPDKAGFIGGADAGGEAPNNPFGDGFLGFEDPFGNLNGAGGAAALAEGKGGNGFIELALKTRRRVYAHLGELLGKPTGTKVSKENDKDPERKISSIKD